MFFLVYALIGYVGINIILKLVRKGPEEPVILEAKGEV
jgi:hypothetical protein